MDKIQRREQTRAWMNRLVDLWLFRTEKQARSNQSSPCLIPGTAKSIFQIVGKLHEHLFRFPGTYTYWTSCLSTHTFTTLRVAPGPSPKLEGGLLGLAADAMVGSPPAVPRPAGYAPVRSCQKCPRAIHLGLQ